jgi:hypothetical protein
VSSSFPNGLCSLRGWRANYDGVYDPASLHLFPTGKQIVDGLAILLIFASGFASARLSFPGKTFFFHGISKGIKKKVQPQILEEPFLDLFADLVTELS